MNVLRSAPLVRLGVLSLATLLVVLPARSSPAAVGSVATCKGLKAQATGKLASDALKAFGRNQAKPYVPKLAVDLSKAGSRFARAFERAEDRGACATTADAGSIGETVSAFVLEAVDELCPLCGDGVVEGVEECDPPEVSACLGLCEADCTCADPACGDGILNAGEECDSSDDAACPGLCLPDCTCAPPGCGNGIIEPGEECDGTSLGTCTGCGAPGTPAECSCCGVIGDGELDYCMSIPCCDPTNWCNDGIPGETEGWCSACAGPGGLCGAALPYGVTVGVCCDDNVCILDPPPLSGLGACNPLTCAVPSDCLGTQDCENGQCCAHLNETCGTGFPLGGSVLPPDDYLQCCGAAFCVPDESLPTGLRSVCDDLTCTTAADCPAPFNMAEFECEDGACCVLPGSACADYNPSLPPLPCCGGASCSKPIAFGRLACCFGTAEPCTADTDCCSGSCNTGTMTCDP